MVYKNKEITARGIKNICRHMLKWAYRNVM